MIFWTGHGYLGALIPVIALMGTQYLVDSTFGEDFYKSNNWPKVLALAIGAVPVWFVGVRLNSGEARLLIDPKTGDEVRLAPPSHGFMFIPLQFWALLLLAIAVVIGIAPLVKTE